MHNNMITINGQKMGKSLGNFINLDQFFSGHHPLLAQAYPAMTIRFFMLQAHYRSPLDFSNDGLQAAEKGLARLLNANKTLSLLKAGPSSTTDIASIEQACHEAMCDDLNTAIALSHLFEAARVINSVNAGTETITAADLERLRAFFPLFVFDILGLKEEKGGNEKELDGVMQLLLRMRADAKARKDFAASDKIRDELGAIGIRIKDEKDGTTSWLKD
jgi:cysteinyl-tRNA synthetase